jgi:hypothetical protein
MLYLSIFFKILYILLIGRALTNYLRFSQFQPKQPLKFILKLFEALTDLLCKPFQNILYFRYDASPILGVLFIHYLGEPFANLIFNLCTKLMLLFL